MRATRPLFRIDPGWLFVLAGLCVCAAGVLLPAQADLAALEEQLHHLQAEEARAYQRLAAHADFIDLIERGEPAIIKRLAATQLNVAPAGDKPLLLAAREAAPVTQWIDSTVHSDIRPMRLTGPSTLSRWATGSSRLWMFGGGIMAVFIGLLLSPEGSRRARRASASAAASPVVPAQRTLCLAQEGDHESDGVPEAVGRSVIDEADDILARLAPDEDGASVEAPGTLLFDDDDDRMRAAGDGGAFAEDDGAGDADTVDLTEEELTPCSRSVIESAAGERAGEDSRHRAAAGVIIEAKEVAGAQSAPRANDPREDAGSAPASLADIVHEPQDDADDVDDDAHADDSSAERMLLLADDDDDDAAGDEVVLDELDAAQAGASEPDAAVERKADDAPPQAIAGNREGVGEVADDLPPDAGDEWVNADDGLDVSATSPLMEELTAGTGLLGQAEAAASGADELDDSAEPANDAPASPEEASALAQPSARQGRRRSPHRRPAGKRSRNRRGGDSAEPDVPSNAKARSSKSSKQPADVDDLKAQAEPDDQGERSPGESERHDSEAGTAPAQASESAGGASDADDDVIASIPFLRHRSNPADGRGKDEDGGPARRSRARRE